MKKIREESGLKICEISVLIRENLRETVHAVRFHTDFYGLKR